MNENQLKMPIWLNLNEKLKNEKKKLAEFHCQSLTAIIR